MTQRPVLQALVLADWIHVDRATGKKAFLGVFNRLLARRFPAQHDVPTFAFVCLTEVRGTVPLSLQYTDLSTNEVLLEMKPVQIHAADPLASVELLLPVPGFPMPHPGTYAFEVCVDSDVIGALRIAVQALDEMEQRP